MLQAAVFQGDYDTVFKASSLLRVSRFLTEMNLKTRGDGETVFNGKSAIDFLSSLDDKNKDHAKIEKGYLAGVEKDLTMTELCLLYTSPSPRDQRGSRMPSSA